MKQQQMESKTDLHNRMRPGMFVEQGTGAFSDRYQGIKVLGKGAFGEVILCKNRLTQAQVAVKVISKKTMKSQDKNAILSEVELLTKLDHPNIMKLFEFYEEPGFFYLVSELYTGGELFDEILSRKQFSEIDAARIFRQVLSGIAYMHSYKIVHRDLKPENLLLADKTKNANIKIIDFGLSTITDPTKRMRDKIGTAYYIAPEVLKGAYTESCDIWSAGVILYILLSGCPPFHGSTEKEILQRVEIGSYNFNQSQWKNTSSSCRELIRKMLEKPDERISAIQALEHEWIQKAHFTDKTQFTLSPEVLNSIKGFHANQKMAQAALLFISSKLTTEEENRDLTKIFEALDTNGDGKLDRNELINAFVNEAQVDEILSQVDFDGDGHISYSEFLTASANRETLLSKTRLQRAFQIFDRDGDGKVSKEELMKLFELGEMGRDEVERMIRAIDVNNDGEIDFEEFEKMLYEMV
eukprot:GHVP01050005.1.p1 GENE.GHVP01050005.1~~GHVP01050005.1.p1  ORF type:complete len:468 (+),score=92.27 GHVP01050005.1:220-1623(+)